MHGNLIYTFKAFKASLLLLQGKQEQAKPLRLRALH